MWIGKLGVMSLVGAGLVNAVPLVAAFTPAQIGERYGIEVVDHDVSVLLQHRGVLFGVLGGGLVLSASRPRFRGAAVAANAISCGAFVLIVLARRPAGQTLVTVAWVDVGVLLLLLVGSLLTRSDDRARQERRS
ncbi:MAG: hypothetical protein ACRCY8_19500 [Dermatophilaceae bacterium]